MTSGPEQAPDSDGPDHSAHGWLWLAAVAFHLGIGVVSDEACGQARMRP